MYPNPSTFLWVDSKMLCSHVVIRNAQVGYVNNVLIIAGNFNFIHITHKIILYHI